jgi:hypothetical protein
MIRIDSKHPSDACDDQRALELLVRALNSSDGALSARDSRLMKYRPDQKELRRLVKSWLANRNINRLLDANPELADMALYVSARIVPTQPSQAKLCYAYLPRDRKPSGREFAQRLFLGFLVGPSNGLLGGPCRNCGRYFVARTKRSKRRYCTAGCGKQFTSRSANQNRRSQEAARKLKGAMRAVTAWSNARTKVPWKDWVSSKTNISKNWLTRAVQSGRLSEPQ